ncbi:hypothetical protein CEXT_239191, partial [Caerostris extrusa]
VGGTNKECVGGEEGWWWSSDRKTDIVISFRSSVSLHPKPSVSEIIWAQKHL